MLVLIIYLIGVLGGLNDLFALSGFLFLIVSFVLIIFIYLPDQEENIVNSLIRKLKPSIITAFSCFLLAALTPSEKTAYLMLGAYATQEVVESEFGSKVLTIINKELDKILTEEIKEPK